MKYADIVIVKRWIPILKESESPNTATPQIECGLRNEKAGRKAKK